MRVWEKRCYSKGIPDVIPDKLAKSGRAPSYRAIAIAILKNDSAMTSLGCSTETSKHYTELKRIEHLSKSEGGLFY